MLKAERQDAMVELTDELQNLSIKEAAERLGVSEMTARRDLDDLAEEGRVARVRGGAQSLKPRESPVLQRERSQREKSVLHVAEKQAIGALAATLVEANDTLFLGTGTTVEAMAAQLPPVHLRVITNSLPVLSLLEQREDVDLYLLGGFFRRRMGAVVGSVAEATMERFGVSKAFIGVNGIAGGHAYTSTTEAGDVQRIALDQASQRYLLADPSKFDRRDFYSFYDLADVDAVVAGPGFSAEAKAAVEQYAPVIE